MQALTFITQVRVPLPFGKYHGLLCATRYYTRRVLLLRASRLGHSVNSRWKAIAAPTKVESSAVSYAADEAMASVLSLSPLKLFNTLSREKEVFTSLEPKVVRFYSCGPTVYDYAHIGNFRAFLSYDLLKRWLLYRGYNVRHVMNLTDVDDKIIKKVNELGCTAKELTDKYTDAFFKDLEQLNILPADSYPRATDHIDDIENVIKSLADRGYAYEKDGSTYFSVSRFENYGRLAKLQTKNETKNGPLLDNTTDNDEYEKEDVRDFALWKAYKEQDQKVVWDTKLGRGRPGWHIECTCMALKYLGETLDIHAGGKDLVFPHHENEIAQSEAYTGKKFARFWMHNGFVNINDEKMSKSLGNFRTLRDLIRKPDDARAFRYLVVTSHYRSDLAFSSHSLKSARSTLKRLDAFRTALNTTTGTGGDAEMSAAIKYARNEFSNAMDDDLNSPRAAAAVFSVVNAGEKLLKDGKLGIPAASAAVACLDDFDKVYGVFYAPSREYYSDAEGVSESIPHEVTQLLEERNDARRNKDWARADAMRKKIASAGYSVLDTPTGAVLEPLDQ